MNLVIDIGNSAVKLAVFEGDHLHQLNTFFIEEGILPPVQDFLSTYCDIEQAIVSSVGGTPKPLMYLIEQKCPVITAGTGLKFPFTNRYETLETLGPDRMALAAGACLHYPGKNALVVDAGSCITYDFIDSNKNYLGGAISPGLRMRYKALNSFTDKLPLESPQAPKDITGANTEESIHSGVFHGMVFEIDGAIDCYKKSHGNLTVILTGGDAEFLSGKLKNSIFARPNFLIEGLNHLLGINTLL